MIVTLGPPAAAPLSSAQKAEILYAQARSDLANRLWQAALGAGEEGAKTAGGDRALPMSLDSLLSLLEDRKAGAVPLPSQAEAAQLRAQSPETSGASAAVWRGEGSSDHGGAMPGLGRGYGPNVAYAATLAAAAERTGLPAAALASIVHAEAAKGADGRWLPYSRNTRSSAAGLGQFLSGTWRSEAERPGTWLNATAQQQGWFDSHGKIREEHRGALLALRYDPAAAIQATADYARANLDALRRAGVAVGPNVQAVAQAAYLGHHLGRGDAVRFLKGGLDPERARVLLNAQIGSARANGQIAASGDAATAHRRWLLDYIGRNIRSERFDA